MITGDEILDWAKDELNSLYIELSYADPSPSEIKTINDRIAELLTMVKEYDRV